MPNDVRNSMCNLDFAKTSDESVLTLTWDDLRCIKRSLGLMYNMGEGD